MSGRKITSIWTAEREHALVVLWSCGFKIMALAEEFGCDHSVIRNRLRRLGAIGPWPSDCLDP